VERFNLRILYPRGSSSWGFLDGGAIGFIAGLDASGLLSTHSY